MGLLYATGAGAVDQGQVPPIFHFQGEDTETVYDKSPANHPDQCTQGDPATVVRCKSASATFAGHPFMQLDRYYNNSKLYIVEIFAADSFYGDIKDSLKAKYGPPANERVAYRRQDTTPTPHLLTTWHFKGGDLELNSVGPKPNSVVVTFFSVDNAPAVERPIVDF